MIAAFYAKLGKRERMLVAAACVAVSLVVMDRAVLGPILARMRVLDVEIEVKSQTIKRNLRVLSFWDSIVTEYAKYSSYMDSGEKTREEIIADLLRKVESLANQKSVTIASVTPGDVDDNQIFQEYKTTLECEGQLGNVLSFMNLLEESDFLFQIKSYTLLPKSKGSEVVKCRMDMSRVIVTAEDISGEPVIGALPQ